MKEWNPRYVAYARAQGRMPEQQLEHDRQRPGKMVGFMLWNGARWREWEKATGWRGTSKSRADHDAYDAWLAAKFPSRMTARQDAELAIPTLFDILDSEAA